MRSAQRLRNQQMERVIAWLIDSAEAPDAASGEAETVELFTLLTAKLSQLLKAVKLPQLWKTVELLKRLKAVEVLKRLESELISSAKRFKKVELLQRSRSSFPAPSD